MGFLSPWFLGGLLAAALPLYVHLLRQHRSEPIKFSSVMFLERRTHSSVKHRRLKYLALLSLRLLVILLLALMFANPFIRRSQAAAGGGRKLVVVAVDNSYSMRAGDRLERAKREAASLISGMGAGDKGQVLSFESHVSVLSQPSSDKGDLQRAIRAIQPGDGRSAYGEIARSLRAIGTADGLPVEAHIITDVQRTSMPTPFAELAVASGMTLKVHAMVDRREPNWYVATVNAPRSVFQPKKVRVQATVAGAGTEAAEVGVDLVMNGRTVESKRVATPANGRASVEFYLPDAAYGLNRGEVRITKGDTLPQDDRMPFSLERKEAQKVLFVYDGRSARSVTYFRTALESVPDSGYTLEPVTVEQAANLSSERYAAVVLSDVSLDGWVKDYASRGGGVLIAVGPALAARGRVPVTGASVGEGRYASRERERFLTATDVDATHPAVARTSNFDAVKFYRSYPVEPAKARVAAKLSDGSALLVDNKIGSGRVLTFASTFDNIPNDLPLHASFIPFVEQAMQYLSGLEGAPAQYPVDSFLELRSGGDAGTAVDVIGPDGKRAMSLKEAASAQAFRLEREGFYEVQRGNGRNELIAVHADRSESDLDVIPPDTLALWQATGAPGASGVTPADGASHPFSLWWYLAFALLIASLVESLFSGRYLSVAQEQPAVRTKAAA